MGKNADTVVMNGNHIEQGIHQTNALSTRMQKNVFITIVLLIILYHKQIIDLPIYWSNYLWIWMLRRVGELLCKYGLLECV